MTRKSTGNTAAQVNKWRVIQEQEYKQQRLAQHRAHSIVYMCHHACYIIFASFVFHKYFCRGFVNNEYLNIIQFPSGFLESSFLQLSSGLKMYIFFLEIF